VPHEARHFGGFVEPVIFAVNNIAAPAVNVDDPGVTVTVTDDRPFGAAVATAARNK